MTLTGTHVRRLFIGGSWVETPSTGTVRLPFDGTAVTDFYLADESTVDSAIRAAQDCSSTMAALSNGERSALLFRVRQLLERDAGEMANLVALETGKPLKEARTECDRGMQTVLESAIAARELTGQTVPIDAVPAGIGRMAMTIRQPVGIVCAITPWNYPLNLALHKIGPALAAGNAVVHKPSEITPLSALKLAALLEEAELPRGAYNVLTGAEDIGKMLVRDPRIAMITFTGSVDAGKWIRANAGLKKVTLELGGNSPVIVEPDADLDLAVSRIAEGGYTHSGQTCISVQRVFVHENIAEEFTSRLAHAVRRLRMAHPLDDEGDISSLITDSEAERVQSWVAEAVEAGARLETGGERNGATVTPTVLSELPKSAKIASSEVFGPVVAVNRYADLDTAIAMANSTPYGLQAGAFTQSLARAFHIAKRLETGGVLINDVPGFRADPMPYGGIKESGLGKEGPRYAIEEMTHSKLICWR